jgi:hypothetical protein
MPSYGHVMRRIITGISGLAVIASTAFIAPALMNASQAANGTGAYGAWTLDSADKTRGTLTFTGTIFPNAALTSTGQNLSVATSQTLPITTPFGAAYGSSRGMNYLSVGLSSGVSRANVTITFDTPPIAGTYGLAMGDVDAENVILSAKDEKGNDVDISDWNGTEFNYAGGTDLPKWDGATGTITGNGVDTAGASMWIVPDQTVKSITLTQTRTSGFPAYQLWIAADIITTTPAASPSANATTIPSAPAGKVMICHRTASTQNPYVLMTIDQSAVIRRGHDGHKGGVFPARPWGDIIPPFGTFPGMNWPAGAPLLNNQCDIGGAVEIAAGLETPTATPSESGSSSPTSSSSASPSASETSAPSASPSSSVIPTSSAVATTTPTATPIPSPTKTQAPADTTPVVVAPEGPTTIETTGLIPKGSEVIGVITPTGGTAEITPSGDVAYTPAPNSSGTQKITLVVRDRGGAVTAVPLSIKVGKAPAPCTALPTSLKFGVNELPSTGAGCQPVKVTVRCSPLARSLSLGDVSFCRTTAVGGRTSIIITGGVPLAARVTAVGKATSTRPAINESTVLFVRN